MTLEALKAVGRQVTEKDWCGQKVYLRKLTAADHLAIFGKAKEEGAKELDPQADREATVAFHIEIVSRSYADSEGNLIAQTEEGQAILRNDVGFYDLVALGDMILADNGFALKDAEKKS